MPILKKEGFTEYFHRQIGVEDNYKVPDKLMEVLYNRKEREELFNNMLEFMDYNVDRDWFHQYFQDEHADRKKKKQDFTPNQLGKLLSRAATSDGHETGEYYEIAAGTGGLMIQHWNEERMKTNPFTYSTWDYFHVVEELSDRTIPFLLFNMMIRGMNGIVIHGDTLSRNCKGAFFIQNFEDDHLGFSDLNVLPYTDEVADLLAVRYRWLTNTDIQCIEEKGKKKFISTVGYYPEHIERTWYDEEGGVEESIVKVINRNNRRKQLEEELEQTNLPKESQELIKMLLS